MGLFKKQKSLFAFADGQTVDIEDVNDEVFSTKMMGEGIAIKPKNGEIYAPTDGKVTMVMDKTKHAIGIENQDGIEMLIHVGLETVDLLGEGFQPHVAVGDDVKVGDHILTFDQEFLSQKGIDDITMLVIVSPNGKTIKKLYTNEEVSKKTSPIIDYR